MYTKVLQNLIAQNNCKTTTGIYAFKITVKKGLYRCNLQNNNMNENKHFCLKTSLSSSFNLI